MKSGNSNTGEFVFLIISIIFIGIVAVKSTLSLFETIDWLRESHSTLKKIDDLYLSFKDTETNAKAYILSGENLFLESYKNSDSKLNIKLDELKKATQDKVNHEEELPVLENLISENINYWKENVDLKENNEITKENIEQIASTSTTSDTLKTVIDKMMLTESNTLERIRKNENFNAILTISTIVMGVLLTIIFSFKYLRIMKRINKNNQVVSIIYSNDDDAGTNLSQPKIKEPALN